MVRRANVVGGGANTNINGLHFEQTTELKDLFSSHPLFYMKNNDVYRAKDNVCVATLYKKYSLYKDFLIPKGIDYKKYISKQLLPDDTILIHETSTLYIIEKKFQKSAGSVDEKLQTCDFKKKEYVKLFEPLKIKVEYCYFLSDWFQKEEYRDVKEYIVSVGCHYFFDNIPMSFFNL